MWTRRRFLKVSAAACSASLAPSGWAQPTSRPTQTMTFSFSTYGAKTLPWAKALECIAATGYDGVEISVMPDWETAPEKLSPEIRRSLRAALQQRRLKLTSFIAHLPATGDDASHRKNLESLRQAAALGHALAPEDPPIIQTVLGGGQWNEAKTLLRDRMADWLEVGRTTHTVIGIKPHRGGVMSRPEEAAWLLKAVGDSPWLRMVYDYSHFDFRDMPMAETVKTSLPYLAHVAVKDAVRDEQGKVGFVLPGQTGRIDYAHLLKLLAQGGYGQDICVEVSGMVWQKSDYDPVAAMRTCYQRLAPAFKQAGVGRPDRPQA